MIKKICQLFRNRQAESHQSYFPYPETWVSKKLSALQRLNRRRLQIIGGLLVVLSVLLVTDVYHVFYGRSTILVLHDSADGVAWVSPIAHLPKPSELATRANIAHYIHLRESFDANAYAYQYRQVNQQSTAHVALSYRQAQLASNQNSFIARLGQSGVRRVHVNGVALLPYQPAMNNRLKLARGHYAQVRFSVVEQNQEGSKPVIKRYSALIAWQYRGVPKDPALQLTNWMGFQVMYYKKRRQISS